MVPNVVKFPFFIGWNSSCDLFFVLNFALLVSCSYLIELLFEGVILIRFLNLSVPILLKCKNIHVLHYNEYLFYYKIFISNYKNVIGLNIYLNIFFRRQKQQTVKVCLFLIMHNFML